jgi:hypothetical protein
MQSISDINNRISKLFKNQHINFLIIMILVLLISCYPLLSIKFKAIVSSILSNHIVILTAVIIILCIGYFDIAIASLMLVFFFILLFSINHVSIKNPNDIEGFSASSNDIDDSQDNLEETNDWSEHGNNITKLHKNIEQISEMNTKKNLKIKAENDRSLDDRVKNIKDVVLGTLNKFRDSNDNDYKKALLENKQSLYQEEQENNSRIKSKKQNNTNNANNTSKKNNISNNTKRKKENFQTVEIRALDPTKEEDTNLLITKEILQDMLNRIEFNYESNKYLRKYIKHRVEEIIDVNKLAEDD